MSDARIADRGYRTYAGQRTGVGGVIRSLIWHTIKQALGIGRRWTLKIAPVLTIIVAFIPAIVFIGITAFIGSSIEDDETRRFLQELDFLPDYPESYSYITLAIALFVTFVGPEVLCPDRRTGMLGMYLASPLTRGTYLLSKGAAVAIVLSIITIGPGMLLLIGFTAQNAGPDTVVDWITAAARIVAGGAATATLFASFSLAVSSLTDRKGIASAAIALILLGSAALSDSLIEGGDQSENFRLMNLWQLPIELLYRIFGQPGNWNVSTAAVVGAYALVTGVSIAVIVVSYRRLDVKR